VGAEESGVGRDSGGDGWEEVPDGGDVEESSGKDEEGCCWDSPLGVLASTREGDDFALAGGTTLGGFEELKKRPPGGFENRE
jgi:hypothetical protein